MGLGARVAGLGARIAAAICLMLQLARSGRAALNREGRIMTGFLLVLVYFAGAAAVAWYILRKR